ncbi:MAG: hypothetical protein WCY12_02000, partial [Candidatus Omnitrophota bacterium]
MPANNKAKNNAKAENPISALIHKNVIIKPVASLIQHKEVNLFDRSLFSKRELGIPENDFLIPATTIGSGNDAITNIASI